jgi:putative ABC transport system permease protein
MRWDEIVQDFRYAVRNVAEHKVFSLTVLLTLASGIGATTAMFSVVNGVALRPLPFKQPDRLVQLYGTPALRGEAVDHLEEFRAQSRSFEALAGYAVSARYLRGPGGAERVMTVTAERGLFAMLGVKPIVGRTFQSDDLPNVLVVSEGFWQQRLESPPMGTGVTVDDEPFVIIGVMPDSFQFPYGAASTLAGVAPQQRTDLWAPLDPPVDPVLRARGRFNYVTGRLKTNISSSAAESELAVIAARLQAENPDPYGPRGLRLAPLHDVVVAPAVRRLLFLLFGAVGIVMSLAGANTMSMWLVRMTLRGREVAVRAAIGATPLRLMRQFLSENLVIAFAGGFAGLALASLGTRWLLNKAAAQIPRAYEVGMDWRVLLFLFAACTIAAGAAGIIPALMAVRKEPRSVLQQSSGHSTIGMSQRRLRDALVIAEIALAFVLIVGAALLIRELVRLRNIDVGMVTKNVVTFHVGHRMTSRGRERPLDSDVRQFDEIAGRASRLPEVRGAGFTQVLPLQNWGWTATSNDLRSSGEVPRTPAFSTELRFVSPGYFQALGIPIKKGRGFTAQDERNAPGVIIINETLARQYFGNEDPIGRDTVRGLIVGVSGNVRQVNVDRPAMPEIYYPIAQNWSQLSELGMALVVSTRGRPQESIEAVRSIVRDVNPNLAVFNIKTMDRVLADSMADFTLYLSLMTSFAVLGLVLALTGTYGVMSHVTTSRMREFAIRVAMGAGSGQVMRLALSHGIRLTAIGLALGLFAVLGLTPLLQDLPVRVRPPDGTTTIAVIAFMAMTAVAACLLPARRAALADPMTVLKDE